MNLNQINFPFSWERWCKKKKHAQVLSHQKKLNENPLWDFSQCPFMLQSPALSAFLKWIEVKTIQISLVRLIDKTLIIVYQCWALQGVKILQSDTNTSELLLFDSLQLLCLSASLLQSCNLCEPTQTMNDGTVIHSNSSLSKRHRQTRKIRRFH